MDKRAAGEDYDFESESAVNSAGRGQLPGRKRTTGSKLS